MGRIREINLLDWQLKSLFGFLRDTGCAKEWQIIPRWYKHPYSWLPWGMVALCPPIWRWPDWQTWKTAYWGTEVIKAAEPAHLYIRSHHNKPTVAFLAKDSQCASTEIQPYPHRIHYFDSVSYYQGWERTWKRVKSCSPPQACYPCKVSALCVKFVQK